MKLGQKLMIAPAVTAAVVLAVSQIDSTVLNRSSAEARTAFEEHMDELHGVAGTQQALSALHVGAYRSMTIIGSLDDSAIAAKRQEMGKMGQNLTAAVDKELALNQEPGSPIAATLQSAKLALGDYLKRVDQAIELASVDPNTGVAAMQTADESYQKLLKDLSDTETLLAEHASQFASEQSLVANRTHWLLSGLSLLAAFVVVAAAAMSLRKIAREMDKAVRVSRQVAEGDLTVEISSNRRDELGDLLKALGVMKDSLQATVSQVRQSSDNIGVASAQIASGNQDLSARTEQAASNLQQTAASMEQLTGTVRNSADAARQANQLASSAAETAVRGGQVVGQVVSTMEEIHHSSQKINDIIGTIDGIAFQTNILALNAAVEAARAGEQGRGFAVVAGEVRTLAQRSAEAAKEIKGLIGASVDKVDTGTRLVAEAGSTMSEIVSSVQRVTDIIGEITAAAGEQSEGIGQVNTAVNQLDQMTQQNAALVEESAAAAQSLRDQASQLAQIVATFRIDGGVTSAPASGFRPKLEIKRPTAVAAPVKPAKPAPSAGKSMPTTGSNPVPAQPKAPVAVASASSSADGDWESF